MVWVHVAMELAEGGDLMADMKRKGEWAQLRLVSLTTHARLSEAAFTQLRCCSTQWKAQPAIFATFICSAHRVTHLH
jgi:hypothetical protein